jgi:hypothetical protein
MICDVRGPVEIAISAVVAMLEKKRDARESAAPRVSLA